MAVSTRRALLALVAVVAVIAAVLATVTRTGSGGSTEAEPAMRPAPQSLQAVETDPAEAAATMTRQLFVRAPAVVLSTGEPDDLAAGAETAAELNAPLLVEGPAADAEIERLDADVVRPGDDLAGVEVAPEGDVDTIVLVRSRDEQTAAIATAESAGATVVEVESGDPRRSADAAKVVADRPDSPVLAVDARRGWQYMVDVVRRDVRQPSGEYLALPGKHYVALYGHPGAPQLGLLGEQGVTKSVARVKKYARSYGKVADAEFVPTFEIIATIASSGAGQDKDYSAEASIESLTPLVDAAEEAGVAVILDLQPGRTDFLTQAKRYEPLLKRPHVGLALDPEWRLKKKQKHLRQIGSVRAAEVNRVGDWLAELTRENHLPQKLFVLHQFSTSMITDRSRVDTGHPELATVIHVDGSGPQGAKQGTWKHLREDAPEGLTGWGWKNFVDEDDPMLTPKQTWRRVKPHPDLITYQ